MELFREYGFVERLKNTGALQSWNTDKYAKYREGFDSVKGMTFAIDAKGNITQHGFATVKDRSTFERYVKDAADRLRAKASPATDVLVNTKNDGMTITSSPFTEKGGLSSPAWQQRFRYHNTVVLSAYGPPDRPNTISRVPLKGLAKIVNPAKKKMWFLTYRPSLVPDMSREALLDQVQRATGIKLQQADNEEATDYALRRTIGDTYLKLFKSLVRDVTEVTAWSEWPTKQQPFRARLELHGKKGTELPLRIMGIVNDHNHQIARNCGSRH